jgi:purine-binding chemotaxis protein CheW
VSGPRQLCTFRVGPLLLGLPLEDVQEVLDDERPVTPVPLAPRAVRGLINLRSQVVLSLDLHVVLQLEGRASGGMNVVLRGREESICLHVDEVGDVLELTRPHLDETPANLRAELRALVSGLWKLDDELLLVLDAAETVSRGIAGDTGHEGRST